MLKNAKWKITSVSLDLKPFLLQFYIWQSREVVLEILKPLLKCRGLFHYQLPLFPGSPKTWTFTNRHRPGNVTGCTQRVPQAFGAEADCYDCICNLRDGDTKVDQDKGC